MATGDDSFKPIQLGGHNIDLDNLHSVCDSGTIDTVSNVAAGSIIVTAGTISEMPEVVIAAGTADIGEIDITGGTINLLVAGTVTEVGNIASGTIAEVTSVSNIVAGTLNEIEGVTNISALDLLKAGTVTSIGNVAGGTLDEVTGVTAVAEVTNIVGGTISRCVSNLLDMVEDGEMFTVSDYHVLDSGGTRLLTANVGGTAIHAWVAVSAKGAARVRLLEGGTTTPAATASNYNRDRTSATTSDTAEWISGTTLAGGTCILDEYLSGEVGPKPSGGGSKSDNGWIFANDLETCIEVVDLSAAANNVSIKANWHEG